MIGTQLLETMRSLAIGVAGSNGAWWPPAVAPYQMGSAEYNQLSAIGRALFHFTDAVAAELREQPNGTFAQRLRHKVPEHIVKVLNLAPLLMCRPDFQLVPTENGLQFVLTEIEIAPFSEGSAQAMQTAYGVSADVAPAFASMLNGRPYLYVGTHEWGQYEKDQLSFCKALAPLGVNGRALYNRTVGAMEAEIKTGQRWADAPIETSLVEHIEQHALQPHILDAWPDTVGDTVIFRFGYVEHFTDQQHALFKRWQSAGATFLNPFSYHLDSKVMLEGVHTPAIRARLDANTLAVLEGCIPETWLLEAGNLAQFEAEKDSWLIKFAGFDQSNTAWGGRSVKFGRDFTATDWHDILKQSLDLNWPVVAQRVAFSQRLTIDYYNPDDSISTIEDGFTRMRTFFLRNSVEKTAEAVHCGSHITVVGHTMNVSESAEGAVQTPVRFAAFGSERRTIFDRCVLSQ